MKKLVLFNLLLSSVTIVFAQEVIVDNNTPYTLENVSIVKNKSYIANSIKVFERNNEFVGEFKNKDGSGVSVNLHPTQKAQITFPNLKKNETIELSVFDSYVLMKYDSDKDLDIKNAARVNQYTSKSTMFKVHKVLQGFDTLAVADCVEIGTAGNGCPSVADFTQ